MKPNKKSENFESLSSKWQQRFANAESNQTKLFNRFVDWYDAFNARIKTQTAVWRSKPYLPIIAQQTWALVAKFSSLRPGFEVKIRSEDTDDETLEERAAAAQKKLEYDYDCPLMEESMRDKIATVLIDACVTGTGIAKVVWKTKEVKRYSREVDQESKVADLTKETVISSKVGYNDFEPVNIFNVFVSPTTDRLNKGWLIIRDFTSIAELKATNEAKGGKFYQNLDKLSGDPKYGEFHTYNKSRNRMTTDDETKDATTETATIYECYESDNIYVFGESKSGKDEGGWVLLRKTKNYYWHGKWPIVKFHIKKRPFNFWGQGLAELAYRLNVVANDLIAHFLDNWNISNNPMWWSPETANVDDYIIEPGAIITYQGQTPPVPISVNEPNANTLQMLLGTINSAIEGVTASQYATGMPNSATDKTKGTATGIVKLQDAAGDTIGYMRENFINSLLQVGKMWFSNNQQFLDRPVDVSVNNNGKTESVKVTPEHFQGEAEIFVDSASMVPKSDEEKRNDALALTKQLLNLQKASYEQANMTQMSPLLLDFGQMAESVAEGFGKYNIESLIMDEDEIAQYHQEKATEEAAMANNMQQGLSPDPNQATEQMVQELAQQGAIDPEQFMKGQNATNQQPSPANPIG